MSDELKECPLCGRTDPCVQFYRSGGMWFCELSCMWNAPAVVFKCLGIGDTKDEARKQAVDKWNTRHNRTCGEFRGDVHETPDRTSDDIELWCEHCDIVIEDGWLFCPNCGAEVLNG